MADQTDSATIDTPAPPPPNAAEQKHSPPAAPPKPDAPPPPGSDGEPDTLPMWVRERLARGTRTAESKILQQLGAKSVDDLAARLKHAEELENAQLSEKERVEKELATLRPKAERADVLGTAVKLIAERHMSELSETQRAAIQAIAGDDPAGQIGAIEALRATWSAPTLPPDAKGGNGAPDNPPQDTAPPRDAPTDQSVSPPDQRARYEELKKINPFAATSYLRRHESEIYPPS